MPSSSPPLMLTDRPWSEVVAEQEKRQRDREEAARKIQEAVRKHQKGAPSRKAADTMVTEGTVWSHAKSMHPSALGQSGLKRVREQSHQNVRRLMHSLFTLGGPLSPKEHAFMDAILQSDFYLSHYTKPEGIKAMSGNGSMLSKIGLQELLKKKDVTSNTPEADETILGNHDYVFFNMDPWQVMDRTDNTRYGNERLVFEMGETPLLETGWIMLRDMLEPKYPDIPGRKAGPVIDFDEHDKLKFWDPTGIAPFGFKREYASTGLVERHDAMQEVFFGPDILPGIALTAIHELRLVGVNTSFAKNAWAARAQDLRTLMGKLFRIQAMIPRIVKWGSKSTRPPMVDGMRVSPVAGDGNCLFSAVAQAHGASYNGAALRQAAVRHMQRNMRHYEGFGVTDRYLAWMENSGTWGGHPELHALSSWLGRRIVVHRIGRPSTDIIGSGAMAGAPIHVLYHMNHYDALL